MNGTVTVVAIILSLAFVTGVVAGIALVIAASVRRAEKAYRRNRPPEQEPPYVPGTGLGDDGPDDAPRWPTRDVY